MEDLTPIALVGTARHAASGVADAEHPADALVAALPPDDRERVFLLRAGARAVFEHCGRSATEAIAPPPAPPESRPVASQRLVGLLQNAMASESRDLFIEFLRQLEATGLLLPPELLPQALGIGDAAIRERLLPVLGERGRWLSRFNADWRWVTAGIGELSTGDRAGLARLWDEGDARERCHALQTLRRSDPTHARDLLQAAIDKEKPEQRVRLLETLAVGLCADDEPLLESRLDDRSEQVRTAAAALLARLPGSALARRMRLRAEVMLTVNSAGGGNTLRLSCRPPEEIDKAWVRDGVPAKAPTGRGKRAMWTEAVLGMVPPSLWCEKFAASPEQLIAAIAEDTFASAVLVGWTQAAGALAASDAPTAAWLRPLWDHWADLGGNTTADQRVERLQRLLPAMQPGDAEAAILPMLSSGSARENNPIFVLLPQLPRPWSVSFGQNYLAAVRTMLKRQSDVLAYRWAGTFFAAGRALPTECFAAALAAWDVAKSAQGDWHNRAAAREFEKFTDTIRTRQSFYDEVAGSPQKLSKS